MDPALAEMLRAEDAVFDREIEAIIRLRRPGTTVPGVRLVARFGRVATCRLALRSVREVRTHPDVVSLKAPRRLGPEPGYATGDRVEVRPTDVRRPTGTRLTGAGVVVGVVDWGMDVDHPSVKNEDGTTRLLALWDQRTSTGPGPSPYGYGRVHTPERINRALRGERPYAELGYHPGIADRGGGAHGCHVLDIAAGNGHGGGPVGLAPEADLVFVHLADRGTDGLANLGDSVRLLEAVDFVARTAGEQPWVVNVSIGRHGGPHDGTTLVELAFDELLAAAPGRFIVQSTGNYYRSRTHAGGVLRPGETRTLTFETDPADTSANELEIWYDGGDELLVRVDPPGGAHGPVVRHGDRADLVAGGQVIGRMYHRANDPNNGDHLVDTFLFPRGGSGSWMVTLEAHHVRNGRFDAWLERDEVCRPCQARFAAGDSNPACSTGTIANGRLPLVVAAYDGHTPGNAVAPFSSAGPTRDGRWKPDLAAPGMSVLAARSARRGRPRGAADLVRKSGSSMAAPHVTGAVALCLQAGRFTAAQIREVVLDTVRPALAGGGRRLGRGYLDLPRLLTAALASRPRPDQKGTAMDAELITTLPLALAPATAYREVLYHPGGDMAGLIGRGFEIVGRPGQWVSDPPRQGDVVLKVTLGRPDGGRCAVVADSRLTRHRTSGGHGRVGWYAAVTDPSTDGPVAVRVLDGYHRVPPGQLLLRPRETGELDLVPIEHDLADEDTEARAPVPVDTAVAVPPFDATERANIRTPLLSAAESARAVAWSTRVHPATSGVSLAELRGALASYVDESAVRSALGASAAADAVLVECVHQFQVKCYQDRSEHDGRAGESTLDSLGLVVRTGFQGVDRRNTNAQRRLADRDAQLRAATGREFSAANWFDRMTDPSVFGQRTKLGNGLHVVLVRKLRQAERHLLTLPAYAGKTPAALGTALGITEKHGGARPTQSGSTSVHTFGLAIDIAYRANPWVRRPASWQAVRRAARLVSGTALSEASAPAYFSSLGADAARSTGNIWDEVQQRSAELVAYFALETDPTQLRAALNAAQTRGTSGVFEPGDSVDDAVRRWGRQIRTDRTALAAGDFSGHEPPGAGFLSHARELVIALRDKGCLAWGAVDLGPGERGSGDIMHFDARIDGAGRALTENTRAFVPTRGHPCLPATTGETEAAEEDGREPQHVLDARKAWAKLFGRSKLSTVRVLDIKQAPALAIANSDFSAWTNSPQTVYVAAAKGADEDYWTAVLYHEGVHVAQFTNAKGRPPSDYATMMKYECEAYTDSGRWTGKSKRPGVRQHSEPMKKRARQLCAEIESVEKATTDTAKREARYQKFLLDASLLPPHGRVVDLYTPSDKTLRNPNAAESTDVDGYAELDSLHGGTHGSDEETAPDRAKDTIRAQARRWGTDEAAILAELRGLVPAQMAEVSTDAGVVDVLRAELSDAELTQVGAELARGRVGSMARADIDRVVAAPARHTFGTLAAALARDVLLGHQEAFDRTGVGTIHGSHCATPKPAGTTTSDCTEYVKDVLNRAFTAKGRSAEWTDVLREAVTRSGAAGLKGTEVIKALQTKCGWEAVFWAPDPTDTADGQAEHPYAWRVVRTKGTYYGIAVDKDKSVVDYRRTNSANPTDLSGVERLRRLQFGVLAARGGMHMAVIVNGAVYEVHWSSAATDRNAVEATPLETFAWQSGVIGAPPGDLALAWRTP